MEKSLNINKEIINDLNGNLSNMFMQWLMIFQSLDITLITQII